MHEEKRAHDQLYKLMLESSICCVWNIAVNPLVVVIRPVFMHKVLCARESKEIEERKKKLPWYQKKNRIISCGWLHR